MIGTMINSAEADIRFAMQYFINGKLYAIDRSATGLPCLHFFKDIFHLIQSQRNTNGNGMSHTALRFIRSHYYYFTQFFHRLYQITDTRRRYTIVIGYKNAQEYISRTPISDRELFLRFREGCIRH